MAFLTIYEITLKCQLWKCGSWVNECARTLRRSIKRGYSVFMHKFGGQHIPKIGKIRQSFCFLLLLHSGQNIKNKYKGSH